MISRSQNRLHIGRWTISASRWPWQGYGWFKPGKDAPRAILNPGGDRFGAGWTWKLGISLGGSTVMFDLLFGIVTVTRSCGAADSVRRNMIITRLVTLGPLAVAVASALYLIL